MAAPGAVRGPTARIAEIGVVAASYAALTIYLAPLSYGQVQLRVAEILKPLVIWEPHLIPAFVIGNFLSNLRSPYVGLWELGWMPFANLVGAVVCWRLGRINAYLGAAAYAVIVSAAVSTMLSVVLPAPFKAIFPLVLTSELVLLIAGVPVMGVVHAVLRRVLGARPGTVRAR
jgi:uncharacterized membrane protein